MENTILFIKIITCLKPFKTTTLYIAPMIRDTSGGKIFTEAVESNAKKSFTLLQ